MWICVCIYLYYVFFIHPPMNACLVRRDWDLKRTHSFPKLRGTMIGDRKLALWFTCETLQPWALLLHYRVEDWSQEGVCGGVGRARWRRNRTVVTNTRSFNLHNTLVLISYFNKTPEAHRPGWPPKTTQDWSNKPVFGVLRHTMEKTQKQDGPKADVLERGRHPQLWFTFPHPTLRPPRCRMELHKMF